MPYPEEAVLVSNAVDARRREFTTVRHCARRAMCEPGLPGAPYSRKARCSLTAAPDRGKPYALCRAPGAPGRWPLSEGVILTAVAVPAPSCSPGEFGTRSEDSPGGNRNAR
ncbi:hypothetical protein [Streptomyces xantholiticus]|uniref:hypothetical protein n=1 Tax=Streptomyces xantholiticus TaxID=68285 RepID=UPI0035713B24